MPDDLGPDPHELFAQLGQRPTPHGRRQRHPPEEVGQVVRQREELQPNSVGGEATAEELRPLYRVLPFLDPLLRRAATVVERHGLFGSFPEVGHDEAHPGIEFARAPLGLGHDAARGIPTGRPVEEARLPHDRLAWRTAHRAGEQVSNFPFQHVDGRDADGVLIVFVLQQAVQRRAGKGCVASKELRDVQTTIACDHRQQRPPPELGAGVVAAPQQGPF